MASTETLMEMSSERRHRLIMNALAAAFPALAARLHERAWREEEQWKELFREYSNAVRVLGEALSGGYEVPGNVKELLRRYPAVSYDVWRRDLAEGRIR